jgi:hypothetical protein
MDPATEMTVPELLAKVRAELTRYQHLLLDFAAIERDGVIHLVITMKELPPDAHVYEAPLHSRDLASPQFAWTFQRMLYDCMHDYLVELFVKTPQSPTASR